MEQSEIQKLEIALGYHFHDVEFLRRALTHSTYANEQAQKAMKPSIPDQQTFSTLGDAVLKAGLILLLMERLETKGAITVTKTEFEKNLKLADVGRRLGLKDRNLILLGGGKEHLWMSGESTLLSDTVEALFAAIFLDSGSCMGMVKNSISTVFEKELKIWREQFAH